MRLTSIFYSIAFKRMSLTKWPRCDTKVQWLSLKADVRHYIGKLWNEIDTYARLNKSTRVPIVWSCITSNPRDFYGIYNHLECMHELNQYLLGQYHDFKTCWNIFVISWDISERALTFSLTEVLNWHPIKITSPIIYEEIHHSIFFQKNGLCGYGVPVLTHNPT